MANHLRMLTDQMCMETSHKETTKKLIKTFNFFLFNPFFILNRLSLVKSVTHSHTIALIVTELVRQAGPQGPFQYISNISNIPGTWR